MGTTNNRFLFHLSKTTSLLIRYVRGRIKKKGLGLSFTQMGILFLLKQNGEMSMGDLSSMLAIDNGALTRLIEKLWQDGLVTRSPHEDDKRMWMAALTPMGMEKTADSRDLVMEINTTIGSILTGEEMEELIRIISKLEEGIPS